MVITRKTVKSGASARARPALRVTLLSVAVGILLLGAATAGAYGYAAIVHLG